MGTSVLPSRDPEHMASRKSRLTSASLTPHCQALIKPRLIEPMRPGMETWIGDLAHITLIVVIQVVLIFPELVPGHLGATACFGCLGRFGGDHQEIRPDKTHFVPIFVQQLLAHPAAAHIQAAPSSHSLQFDDGDWVRQRAIARLGLSNHGSGMRLVRLA